ncbi:hypothetical protein C0993_011653 [Termitomyces sp. T159_Od127]|nr:hypothetical protein C0993_011653 [Termitomyces sp. T159_Od127]
MASLLIAWQLRNKNVLIIGGGEIAAQRIDSILITDANVNVLAPHDGLNLRVARLIHDHPDRITYHDRLFAGAEELQGMDMVLTALEDTQLSREICDMCRKSKIPVNAADIPDLCDFYFGSQIRDGPLQVMISTNGNGPKMANLVKKKLQSALTGVEGSAIAKVGELRAQLKIRAPGVGGEVGKRRMKWMTDVCNTWDMEELALLDDTMIQQLLDDGWGKSRVPTFADLKGTRLQPTSSVGMPFIFGPTLGFAAGVLITLSVWWIRRK